MQTCFYKSLLLSLSGNNYVKTTEVSKKIAKIYKRKFETFADRDYEDFTKIKNDV